MMEDPATVQPIPLPETLPTSLSLNPGSNSPAHFPSAAGYSARVYQRNVFPTVGNSTLLEHIEPVGHGSQIYHRRPDSRESSPRPSNPPDLPAPASADASASEDYEESQIQWRNTRKARVSEKESFVLEEIIDGEVIYGHDIEIVHPDRSEDDKSEKGRGEDADARDGIVSEFRELHCDDEESDEEGRRYRRKKKRWSAGLFKRSHSQSVGSDTDTDNAESLDAHDVGSSARRLRRRVRGPGDRSSLIFDDLPPPNVVEVEEPDENGGDGSPLQTLETDWDALEALPFWTLDDLMDFELGSSDPSSAR